ncbi:hypothetical protein AP285_23095 [Limnospira platensis YZ]|nr:hypothetical protein AP285_23095 [Arthrospira platensis YZ]
MNLLTGRNSIAVLVQLAMIIPENYQTAIRTPVRRWGNGWQFPKNFAPVSKVGVDRGREWRYTGCSLLQLDICKIKKIVNISII